MNLYYTIYITTTLTAAAILILLSRYAWKRRSEVPGAHPFFWMMFVFWGWMVFWSLELLSQNVSLMMLVNNIRYSFVLFVAYTIHVFVLHFCGWRTWVQPQRLLLLAFIPIIGVLLIWTNPSHHLVWQIYEVSQQGAFLVPTRIYGPWFPLQAMYNHTLTFFSLALLLHASLTHPPRYRLQFVILFIGTISLVLADVFWLFRLVRGPGLYPFSLVFIGLLFSWSLFRYQFLDLIPVAHHVIFQTMHDGIIVLDKQNRVVALNPAAEQLAGMSAPLAIGKPVREVLPSAMSQDVESFSHLEHVVRREIACPMADTVHTYEAQVTPLKGRRRRLTGQVIVLRDVTTRKQMEHALQASEERFRMLAEHAHHVIFRLQLFPTRHFDYISPALTDLSGYTPAEVYADPDLFFKIAHPESRGLLMALSDVSETPITSLTLRYIRKDGREIWVEHEHWTVYGEDGQPVAVEGVVRDITNRKRAEQQVIEQQTSLTMLRERERLARELHDSLGQVLGSINIQAQSIQDLLRMGDTHQTIRMLEQIIQVSQGAFTDVREYILGVQIQTTTQQMAQPRREQPETGPFLASLETYVREFSTLSGLNATIQGASEPPYPAFGPTVETHLLRIIQEALSNVRKHACASSVQVRFAFSRSPDAVSSAPSLDTHSDDERAGASWATVTIQDDGQGFTPPVAGQEPPYDRGHGYGLESMRSRAAECGGTLAIESAPATGTRITIHLPLQGDPTSISMVHPVRVLLADDNTLFLSGIVNLLTRQGFQVVGTASDGVQAVEQAVRLQPDIILMDIQMPGGGGIEATRTIKLKMPACHIVMLTVSEDEHHLFEALKSGASGYLLKNMDSSTLGELLRGLSQGEVPFSPGIAEKILREFARIGPSQGEEPPASSSDQQPGEEVLSDYEIELLKLVAEGQTYHEISTTMHFSERSIKRYMSTILKKLHLKNRADAITYARQQGLVP